MPRALDVLGGNRDDGGGRGWVWGAKLRPPRPGVSTKHYWDVWLESLGNRRVTEPGEPRPALRDMEPFVLDANTQSKSYMREAVNHMKNHVGISARRVTPNNVHHSVQHSFEDGEFKVKRTVKMKLPFVPGVRGVVRSQRTGRRR